VFVVDSSVWIDFYAERWGREASLLRAAIDRDDEIALCGPILQEVLQGFQDEASFNQEWKRLQNFTVFETTRWTFLRAASLYRQLRRKGATINSFDTTIAAVCLEQGMPLLTCDRRGFEPMAKYAGLRLL
jgi:hypothetical protein